MSRNIQSLCFEMGNLILKRWSGVAFDLDNFHEISTDILEKYKDELLLAFSFPQILYSYLSGAEPFPVQPTNQFSEFQLRLFSHQLFSIDLLSWNKLGTDIHEHSFNGSFLVLSGDYLQFCYEFDEDRRISDDVVFGSVKRKASAILGPGSVQKILPGNDFIHSTLHLKTPSFSLVIRVHSNPKCLPQFGYLRGGIKFHFTKEKEYQKASKISSQFRFILSLVNSKSLTKEFFNSLSSCISEREAAIFLIQSLGNLRSIYLLSTETAILLINNLQEKYPILMQKFLDSANYDSSLSLLLSRGVIHIKAYEEIDTMFEMGSPMKEDLDRYFKIDNDDSLFFRN